ncbi:hypothetical protein WR25_24902 [Diploscapter pachys]|uniref:NAD-specific glutamate dehydrogenase n=1 Tax=Diploscapter pachys TaxID=2018661 RepID=A0A2A2M314_9BILA|nr:hypothetical protein WR25_24902 [Diploscapter pachys]
MWIRRSVHRLVSISARLVDGRRHCERSEAIQGVVRATVGAERAFVHHLAQRGVREHRFHQLVLSRFQLARDDIALDQLGHFRADHVRTQQLAGLGVEHRLDEAFRLAQRDRLAVANEGELADLHVMARILGLRFGQADAGDLRAAVGAAGDVPRLERVRVLAGDLLDADDAFVARLMRQPGRAGDVADRVDALDVRPAVAVDLDVAALRLDAQRLQPDILGVRHDADRDDRMAEFGAGDLAVCVLDRGGDAVRARLQLFEARLGEDLDPLLGQRLGHEFADFGILDR